MILIYSDSPPIQFPKKPTWRIHLGAEDRRLLGLQDGLFQVLASAAQGPGDSLGPRSKFFVSIGSYGKTLYWSLKTSQRSRFVKTWLQLKQLKCGAVWSWRLAENFEASWVAVMWLGLKQAINQCLAFNPVFQCLKYSGSSTVCIPGYGIGKKPHPPYFLPTFHLSNSPN